MKTYTSCDFPGVVRTPCPHLPSEPTHGQETRQFQGFIIFSIKSMFCITIKSEAFALLMGNNIFCINNKMIMYVYINVVHLSQVFVSYAWASARENLSSWVCEQQRRRPACAYHAFVVCLTESIMSRHSTSEISMF